MIEPNDPVEGEISFKAASCFAFAAVLVAGQAGAPAQVLDELMAATRTLQRLAGIPDTPDDDVRDDAKVDR